MAGAGWKKLTFVCAAVCLLSGCAIPETGNTIGEILLTEMENTDTDITKLERMTELPGMKDGETAGMFGGGKENWTEDRSFYIGRIYQMELYGNECSVFTSCNEDKIVESVSLWIVNGEHEVTDAETEKWLNRISEVMGSEPFSEYQSAESGTRSWKWTDNELAAGLYRMKDILTLSFQPVSGGMM